MQKKNLYSRLKQRLKRLKSETNTNYDKYLRAVAELDNFRKRAAKEWLERENEAKRNLALKILPILDNFRRALDSAKTSKDFDPFHEGVEMICHQLKSLLETEGVKEFSSVGEEFDPAKHEAVLLLEHDEVPSNIVIHEIEKGYTFNNRLLRPAKVAVSKGVSEVKGAEEPSATEGRLGEEEQEEVE
ncbi:MAG: nucleotide exchange factor GrpE [Candidatus Edwardsbacteria bacterium]